MGIRNGKNIRDWENDKDRRSGGRIKETLMGRGQ